MGFTRSANLYLPFFGGENHRGENNGRMYIHMEHKHSHMAHGHKLPSCLGSPPAWPGELLSTTVTRFEEAFGAWLGTAPACANMSFSTPHAPNMP